MPKDGITTVARECNPYSSYGLPQQLFTIAPRIPTQHAKDQASKLMDCACYLNHTGVMWGDHQMVAASHHLNMMVRALLDQLEAGPC